MKLSRGYIQVYTGNGKGKTTAAIGLAVRALGHGFRVYFAQFMKNFPYGELEILKRFASHLVLKNWGNDAFVFNKQPPSAELVSEMQKGLSQAREAMLGSTYDLVILDEVLVSIYFKLFTIDQVVDFLKVKPANVELVLTGRYCPQEILELADLVTNMEEIKHYYHRGVSARKGIEN